MKQPGQKPENPDPKVEIIPSEKPQQISEEVVLDANTGKLVEAPAAPSISTEEIRKLQATVAYQARQNERIQRELQEAMHTIRNRPAEAPAEKPQEVDEIDRVAQTDWKRGVSMLAEREAEKKFKALMDQEKTRNEQEFAKQRTISQLEREKAWVLERTPSLSDENSEEFRGYYNTYNQMLQEDPSLAANPRAPRLIYYEWKDRQKVDPDPKEIERLKRVAGGQVPQARGTSGSKTIRLTEDELELCKKKGISPAVYAQMKEANYKEGVTA